MGKAFIMIFRTVVRAPLITFDLTYFRGQNSKSGLYFFDILRRTGVLKFEQDYVA